MKDIEYNGSYEGYMIDLSKYQGFTLTDPTRLASFNVKVDMTPMELTKTNIDQHLLNSKKVFKKANSTESLADEVKEVLDILSTKNMGIAAYSNNNIVTYTNTEGKVWATTNLETGTTFFNQ